LGKTATAITLSYELTLEPDLSPETIGFGRFWSGDSGSIFSNESLVNYPVYDPSDFNLIFRMSDATDTFPVAGITDTGFRYLRLEISPTYGISLNPASNHDFGTAQAGYAAQAAHHVTIVNTGNQLTGQLIISLTGANPKAFTLSGTSITDIIVGGSDSLTVSPNTGLASGTYTATVEVSGNNGISESFNVSFRVTNPPKITSANNTTVVSGTGGTFQLMAAGDTPIAFSLDGTEPAGVTISGDTLNVVAAVPAGTYNFVITASNGVNPDATQSFTLTVSAANIPTYTIIFNPSGGSVTPTGAVTGTDGRLSSLPIPTISGSYAFDGWWTAAGDGALVTTDYVFSVNTTIYARWTYTGGTTDPTKTDPSNKNASITPTGAAFDKKAGGDISVTLYRGDYTLIKLTNGSYTLISGTDYAVNGNVYTIKASYLNALAEGTRTIAFLMSGGADPRLTVTIKDTTPQNTSPFKDVVNSAWYYDAVMYVFEEGLMIGTADDMFSPNVNLARATIVTILYRLEGEPSVTGLPNPFDDVAEGVWYADAVKWGAANGIVKGYGDGRFGPNDPITKEQLAALIYRTQQSNGKAPPDILMDHDWPDWDKIGDWAKNAVNVLTIQGLFRDIPGGSFNPQTPAARAEVASILYRYQTAIE
jgi:hypothetical protein